MKSLFSFVMMLVCSTFVYAQKSKTLTENDLLIGKWEVKAIESNNITPFVFRYEMTDKNVCVIVEKTNGSTQKRTVKIRLVNHLLQFTDPQTGFTKFEIVRNEKGELTGKNMTNNERCIFKQVN